MTRFEDGSTRCPVCRTPGRAWHTIRGHRLLRCPSCGHGYLADAPDPAHLAALYDRAYFCGDADGYPDYVRGEPIHRFRARDALACLARHVPHPGRLLDVGCAAGFLLAEARDAGWTAVGAEPSASMRAYAREVLRLEVHPATGATLASPGRLFDAVSLIQTLEHMGEPPRRILSSVAAQLRPGGLLLLETWDADSWTARLTGRFWQQLSPPSVQHWYTQRSLRRALPASGFELIELGRPGKLVDLDHVLWLLERSASAGGLTKRVRRTAARLGLDRATFRYRLDDLVRVVARKADCAPAEAM